MQLSIPNDYFFHSSLEILWGASTSHHSQIQRNLLSHISSLLWYSDLWYFIFCLLVIWAMSFTLLTDLIGACWSPYPESERQCDHQPLSIENCFLKVTPHFLLQLYINILYEPISTSIVIVASNVFASSIATLYAQREVATAFVQRALSPVSSYADLGISVWLLTHVLRRQYLPFLAVPVLIFPSVLAKLAQLLQSPEVMAHEPVCI